MTRFTSFSDCGEKGERAPLLDHIFLKGSWTKTKVLNRLVGVGSRIPGKEWLEVLRKASQIFRLANALSDLYPMDRQGMRLLDAMLLDHAMTVKRPGGRR